MRFLQFKILGLPMLASASLLAALAHPSDASAQTSDTRWLAWVGCWEGAGVAQAEGESPLIVCFQPTEGEGDAVESLTYDDGDLLGSEILRADGVPVTIAEGGCEGTRTMNRSSDGLRIFSETELTCGDGVVRSTRGVFTFLAGGAAWSEVLAVSAGESDTMLEIRSFVPASPALLIEAGIEDPSSEQGLAVNTARMRAGAALGPSAIVELVREAGAPAASGVLVERGEVLDPDAEMLRALSRQGVPGEVLDLVVALSYPDRFQIAGGAATEVAEASAGTPSREVAFAPRPIAPWGGSPRVYYPWGGGYNPGMFGTAGSYGAAFYGADYFGFPMNYYGYRYNAFGYRAAPYSYPRYIVVQPPVVVNPGPPSPPPARVDRNSGFSGGGSGSSATPRPSSNAAPRTAPAASSSPARASEPSSSGGGSSSEPRRAVPRN